MVIWYVTAGEEGQRLYHSHLGHPDDWKRYQTVFATMARMCPDIIAAVQGYIATWRACFFQDWWDLTQWDGYCDGVNGVILEMFVADTRQQVLVACERNAS